MSVQGPLPPGEGSLPDATEGITNGTEAPPLSGAQETMPPGAGGPAAFWQSPLGSKPETGDTTWYPPLLPFDDSIAQNRHITQMLGEMGQMLRERNLPMYAWLLPWVYYTQAAAANAEMLALMRDPQARKQQIRQERQEVEGLLSRTQGQLNSAREAHRLAATECADAMAGAGIACDPDRIHPERLEDALWEAVPDTGELAGEHQVHPAYDSQHGSQPKTIDQVMEIIAPVVSGALLALAMGVQVGLLSLFDLQRGDRVPQLLGAAILGGITVFLMGALITAIGCSLARALEPLAANGPRPRAALGIALVLLLLALLLGSAEATVEALGLQELHRQRLEESARLGVNAGELLPIWVYLLMGMLFSGPYLAYKAAKTWDQCQRSLREVWLRHLQRAWVQERRSSAEMQKALRRAHEVVRWGEEIARVETEYLALREKCEVLRAEERQLDEEHRERLNDARVAATAMRERLDHLIRDLIATVEPLPEGR